MIAVKKSCVSPFEQRSEGNISTYFVILYPEISYRAAPAFPKSSKSPKIVLLYCDKASQANSQFS